MIPRIAGKVLSEMTLTRVYPMDEEGAAYGVPLVEGAVELTDLTSTLRFGIKGSGSVKFLESEGYTVPDVNRITGNTLRLGRDEVVVVNAPLGLRTRWEAAPYPKGYYGWREETWAMMHLSGNFVLDLMSKISPVDLGPERFTHGMIAQTRVGYLDAIVWRDDRENIGFSVMFDIASTAFFANAVSVAAEEFQGRSFDE
jgi:sarcosine oxidase, subunit gamma